MAHVQVTLPADRFFNVSNSLRGWINVQTVSSSPCIPANHDLSSTTAENCIVSFYVSPAGNSHEVLLGIERDLSSTFETGGRIGVIVGVTEWVGTITSGIVDTAQTYTWRFTNSGDLYDLLTGGNGSTSGQLIIWDGAGTNPFGSTSLEAPGTVTSLGESGQTQTSISWAWEAPTTGGAVAEYEYRYTTGSGSFSGAWVSTGLTKSVTITGLSASTTYKIQVRATNAGGDGTAEEDSATTNNPGVTAPGTPTSLGTGVTTATSINYGWSAPNTGGTVVSYEYRHVLRSGTFSGPWITVGSDTDVTVTGLTANTNYKFQVRARNTGGTSTTPAQINGETTQTADVIRPTFVRAQLSNSGNYITATYSENLDNNHIPSLADFDVLEDGNRKGGAAHPSAGGDDVLVSGSTVEHYYTTAISPTSSLTMSYTNPGDSTALQDAAGNEVNSYGPSNVNYATVEPPPPPPEPPNTNAGLIEIEASDGGAFNTKFYIPYATGNRPFPYVPFWSSGSGTSAAPYGVDYLRLKNDTIINGAFLASGYTHQSYNDVCTSLNIAFDEDGTLLIEGLSDEGTDAVVFTLLRGTTRILSMSTTSASGRVSRSPRITANTQYRIIVQAANGKPSNNVILRLRFQPTIPTGINNDPIGEKPTGLRYANTGISCDTTSDIYYAEFQRSSNNTFTSPVSIYDNFIDQYHFAGYTQPYGTTYYRVRFTRGVNGGGMRGPWSETFTHIRRRPYVPPTPNPPDPDPDPDPVNPDPPDPPTCPPQPGSPGSNYSYIGWPTCRWVKTSPDPEPPVVEPDPDPVDPDPPEPPTCGSVPPSPSSADNCHSWRGYPTCSWVQTKSGLDCWGHQIR